jgi:hypothetical protein
MTIGRSSFSAQLPLSPPDGGDSAETCLTYASGMADILIDLITGIVSSIWPGETGRRKRERLAARRAERAAEPPQPPFDGRR